MQINHPYKEKYEKVYEIYFPKLVRFSQAYINSYNESENIVQEIFLSIWQHPDILSPGHNINAFLFTAVKNRCIDFLRKNTQSGDTTLPLSTLEKKELELKLYSLQEFGEGKLSYEDIETIISNAINSLPERCREIFILSRFEGMRHKEIAKRLNISTTTIEGQISIALKKLRKELKDYLPLFIFIA